MPTVQRFGAVSVRMYADDHRPPHFHIVAPDFQAGADFRFASDRRRGAPRPNRRGPRVGAGASRKSRPEMGRAERTRLTMPKRVLPRIVAVTLGEAPLTLHVRWDRGGENSVDVSDMVASFRVYAPLRSSPELFRQVQVGEYGTDIVWPGDIDMSADTLWRLAQEQSGATMTPDEFRQWRERKAYTLDEAARALGLSRRMVAYYEKGNRPIPRVVALATRGLELV